MSTLLGKENMSTTWFDIIRASQIDADMLNK
jgi:hypothetical protein